MDNPMILKSFDFRLSYIDPLTFCFSLAWIIAKIKIKKSKVDDLNNLNKTNKSLCHWPKYI